MSDESANSPVPEPASGSRRQGRGVLCKKCEHLNPVGLELCEYCEEALFVTCPKCSTVNARILSQCSECRSPLQQSFRDKMRKTQAEPAFEKVREPAKVTTAGRGILCAKCEHLNPGGRETCEFCESSLFIECPKCAVQNVRAYAKCLQCKTPLHRSLKDRLLGGARDKDSESEKSRTETKVHQAGRGVLCSKCEHLNPTGIDKCEHCETELFIDCPSCSVKNIRALAVCTDCRKPLHPTLKNRFLGGSKDEDSKTGKTREPAKISTAGRGILCAKCEHLNPSGLENCEHCESLLFVNCPSCSVKNVRALSNCSECRTPLHRSLKDRLLGTDAGPGASGRGLRVPTEAKENGKGVLCAKCDHLNPAGLELCEYCNGHLYLVCRDCGHTNARVLLRCAKCDRRLHRSIKDKMRGGNESKPLNLIYAGIAAVAIVAVLVVVVKMSGLRLFK